MGASALVVGLAAGSSGVILPGTEAKNVGIGLDNDNATNPFIQPPGVTAKQHMDNTDVLFGRDNDDLLIGNLGGDTLLAGADDDILIGGPEKGQAPNSDVLVGDTGKDVNIWAPGDGSDAFIGNEGKDTMIFAPFVENTDGSLLLTSEYGRKIPHVKIDSQPAFTCTVVPVPESEQLGAQFLVRFNVGPNPVVTVRQKDVEKVYCPSPEPGKATFARLTGSDPTTFTTVSLDQRPRPRGRDPGPGRVTAMRSHAVVVGASMAGLLAARSLLDHYERVTIVDRDDIPSRPQPRGGVPQGRHAHGLLAEGRTILEEMFPGLTSDLTARGARLGDVGLEGVWCFTPRPLARRESGLTALLVSRSLLEWYVRERVAASPTVTLREDASVLDLAFSGDDTRVVGVIVQDRDGGTPALLPADLVVDAIGAGVADPGVARTARLPGAGRGGPSRRQALHDRTASVRPATARPRGRWRWRPSRGCTAAASCWPRRAAPGWSASSAASGSGRPSPGRSSWPGPAPSPRHGWPTRWSALEPLGEGATYRFPANRRRHYEDLTQASPRGWSWSGTRCARSTRSTARG